MHVIVCPKTIHQNSEKVKVYCVSIDKRRSYVIFRIRSHVQERQVRVKIVILIVWWLAVCYGLKQYGHPIMSATILLAGTVLACREIFGKKDTALARHYRSKRD